MGLFGFGRKKGATAPNTLTPEARAAAAKALVELLETSQTEAQGRIRVEDLLSAAAAVAGERCIAAAGEFDPEAHDFAPGSAVFSERINAMLCNEARDWTDPALATSVFGIVRGGALARGYAPTSFPGLEDVFRTLAGGIGAAGFGRVPLTVPEDNTPRPPPLRSAYELRGAVKALMERYAVPPADQPLLCAIALSFILGHVKDAVDHGVALRLVFETLNGMAKTAPMTERHMREAQAAQAGPQAQKHERPGG
ncbi:MAG TPA: hypothetical protein VG939_22140 [Caulobacteraceae bacterium]|nr:hypothetical protein [Caulobacteraceae bacterium]